MRLRYIVTREAPDATQLPRVVRAARWPHIDALGGLWVIDQDQGRQWQVPPIGQQ